MIIIIKLGTRILTCQDGNLDRDNIFRISREIGGLIDSGIQVMIISSGAIGAGCGRLGCNVLDLDLRHKQALASVGQTDLMNIYREAFSELDKIVGQILLTTKDLADRKGYLNIRNTLFTLLKMDIVPVINENDTVAVEEIKFGDNDRLAGIIASKVDADKLIILTDVDGLMDRQGKIIKEVEHVDDSVFALADGKGSDISIGGMHSKIETARNVKKICGADTYLANGRTPGVITDISEGRNPGTVFKGGACGISHKKRWIAAGLFPLGSLKLDEGAVNALTNKNSSLLAVGITGLVGNFKQGDSVECLDADGNVVARGLTNYTSSEIMKIKGKKSDDIESILGFKDYDEVIHKDNLILV